MMDYAVIERIIAWLLTYAVHSTLLIVLATLIAGGNSKLPLVVRDTIWKAALVGGIATASLQHIAGIRPWASTPQPLASTIEQQANPAVFALDLSEPVAPAPVEPTNFTTTNSPPSSPVFSAADTESVGLDWRNVVVAVWLVGLLIGLIRLGFAHIGLRRILSARTDVTELQLLSALTEMRHRARIYRPLHLTQSDRLAAAVALRNEICMPVRVFSDLSLAHRKAMMAHKVVHIARHDNLWLTISLLIERIFFFQPLNRLARKHMQEVAELLCDDWAVVNTGHQLTFAECLAEVAGWVLNGKATPVVAPSFASRRSQLVRRVERVLAPGSNRDWGRRRLQAIAAVVGLLLFGFSAPGFASADPKAETPNTFDIPLVAPVIGATADTSGARASEPAQTVNDLSLAQAGAPE